MAAKRKTTSTRKSTTRKNSDSKNSENSNETEVAEQTEAAIQAAAALVLEQEEERKRRARARARRRRHEREKEQLAAVQRMQQSIELMKWCMVTVTTIMLLLLVVSAWTLTSLNAELQRVKVELDDVRPQVDAAIVEFTKVVEQVRTVRQALDKPMESIGSAFGRELDEKLNQYLGGRLGDDP